MHASVDTVLTYPKEVGNSFLECGTRRFGKEGGSSFSLQPREAGHREGESSAHVKQRVLVGLHLQCLVQILLEEVALLNRDEDDSSRKRRHWIGLVTDLDLLLHAEEVGDGTG